MTKKIYRRHTRDHTTGWYFDPPRIGRVKLGLSVYRHTYANCSDRWVIQPTIIYDRKEHREQGGA